MRAQLTISGAHLAAARAFSTSEVLKLVPPPNEKPEDLNRHIRRVLGVDHFRDVRKMVGRAA